MAVKPRTGLLLAALALALALAGCDGGSSTAQGGSQGSAQPSGVEQGQSPHGQAQSPGRTQDSERAKGGEASIEGFGSEAEGAERRAILSAFGGYLGALSAKDSATACADLSQALHESLAQLAGGAKSDCAQILPKLLSPDAPEIARAQAQGKIAKVRVEGERAFVVFHAPGAKLYYLMLVEEGGEWRVASAAAAVLVPKL